MRRKQKFLVASIAVISLLAYGGYKLYWLVTPHRGGAFETKEVAGHSFQIRVTAYDEKGVWLPGAYYVFESSPIGSNEWREIMSIHADDPNPIPRDVVGIVNEQTGYVYMHNMYAVTTDGGRTWSIWDADKELQNRRDIFSRAIEEVKVAANGTGRMRLYKFSHEPSTTYLKTEDYGQHWSVE